MIPVTLDSPTLIEVDVPDIATSNSRAVDHGELPTRVCEHHLDGASVVASRAEEVVFFDYHDYSLTKKIVLSTIIFKKSPLCLLRASSVSRSISSAYDAGAAPAA